MPESHVKVDSFIKGLKEAEEEPSGDEDENIEVVYSKAAREPRAGIGECDITMVTMILIPFKVMGAP